MWFIESCPKLTKLFRGIKWSTFSVLFTQLFFIISIQIFSIQILRVILYVFSRDTRWRKSQNFDFDKEAIVLYISKDTICTVLFPLILHQSFYWTLKSLCAVISCFCYNENKFHKFTFPYLPLIYGSIILERKTLCGMYDIIYWISHYLFKYIP